MPYSDSDEGFDPLSGKIAVNPHTDAVEKQDDTIDFVPSQLMPAAVFQKSAKGKQALYQEPLGEKTPS